MRIMPIMTNYAANNIRFRGDVGDLGDDDQYTYSYSKHSKKRCNKNHSDDMHNNLRTTTFALAGNTLILFNKDGSKDYIDLTDNQELLDALKRIN